MPRKQSALPYFAHEQASVETGATVGADTKIWAGTQIRSGAVVGQRCVVGRNCFIDLDVTVGNDVKIQNNSSLYEGLEVADGVFIGPHVVFTNDRVPRAVTPSGALKSTDDWDLGRTRVETGAAIGANSVIVTGITVGEWSMVGAGSVVTKDVPAYALVVGNPARRIGWVSASGARFDSVDAAREATELERGATQ